MKKPKSLMIILIIALFVMAGCTSKQVSNDNVIDDPNSENGAMMEDNESQGTTMDNPNSDPMMGSIQEFDMIAKNWEFIPNTITVNKGDKVILHITSADVKHGFALSEFGINQDINPGETTTVEFTADKSGEFNFRCSVFCGEGHKGMEGQLIVN